MREPRCMIPLPLLLILLLGFQAASAQVGPTSLQPGTPIERALAAGQSHSYTINLEQDQFLQLVVDQRGIDVVVRVFSPAGRRLSEVDTPNGTGGPEDVTVIAEAAGVYRIEVTPLDPTPPPGRYEIKIVELRKATEEELQSGKNQEVLKGKGLALLSEATQILPQLHRPQTRAGFQIRAANLLWGSDEKLATKLMEQAIESVKEFIADIENSEQEYYESFQIAMQLREQVVDALAPHDPEMALNFLRATRSLSPPEMVQVGVQGNQELQLELLLASQIIAADPKRAFQMAEDTLKRGASPSLNDTLNRLRSKDPELAAKLAHDIATKIMNERLLRNPEAAYLASGFLHLVRPGGRTQLGGGGDGAAPTGLISEDEFRDLFQKILTEALLYSPPSFNVYNNERNVAQNLFNTLKQMSADLQRYAPDRAAAFEKKWLELNNLGDPQSELRLRLQNTVNSGPPDAALESVNQAPREMRDQLYQQVANRIAQTGDVARARQLINERITNPMQRQQALRNLDQQAIYSAIARGKFDEALRSLSSFRPVERAQMLGQIVNQIGPGLKKSTALQYLEQARAMLSPSPQAEDQQQMFALLAIGRAFSRLDTGRAFEIVEPLVDQFNDISAAALSMNGFGQKYYKDGEVIMTNGNALAETGNQLATTLGNLAMANFERAKAAADRIHPVDLRLNVYLAIAQQTIQPSHDRTVE
jgi:hypothetical protein